MGLNETSLTKKISDWWHKQGSYVIKFHGNEFTQQGVPDLILCYKGRFIGIEIKVGSNKPSPIQHEHIRRINEWYEGKSFWCNEYDWEEQSIKIKEKIDNDNTKI